MDFDGGLVFFGGVVVLAGSSSVRFRFFDFSVVDLMTSLPNHDGSWGVSSTGTAFASSSSSFETFFPRKASAFFFLFESLSPAMVTHENFRKISDPQFQTDLHSDVEIVHLNSTGIPNYTSVTSF